MAEREDGEPDCSGDEHGGDWRTGGETDGTEGRAAGVGEPPAGEFPGADPRQDSERVSVTRKADCGECGGCPCAGEQGDDKDWIHREWRGREFGVEQEECLTAAEEEHRGEPILIRL